MISLVLAALLAAAPAGARVIHGPVNELTLETGEQVVVDGICKISRIAASAQPFDVKPIGSDQLLIEGYEEGRGTLIGWCSDQRRFSMLITVRANPELASARQYLRDRERLGDAAPVPPGFQQGQADRLIHLRAGESLAVDVASDAAIVDEAPEVTSAKLDGARMQLEARAPGAAIVRVRHGDNERVYLVVVTERVSKRR